MYLTVNGARTHVLDEGSGPPIVFVHGLGASFRNWERQFDEFAASHRCIAADTRGAGSSETGSAAYSLELFADDVVEVCAQLGVSDICLVGQSYGGLVAQTVALRHPGLVGRLVLIATGCYRRPDVPRALPGLLAECVKDGRALPVETILQAVYPASFRAGEPDVVRDFGRELSICDPADLLAKMTATQSLDNRAALAGLDIPTLVIGGELDSMFAPADVRLISECLPQAELMIVAGAGHQVHVEAAPVVNARLRAFLARTSVARVVRA